MFGNSCGCVLIHNIRNTSFFSIPGKAMFGPELTNGVRVSGTAAVVDPIDGCGLVLNRSLLWEGI